jgi:hypothetical protein
MAVVQVLPAAVNFQPEAVIRAVQVEAEDLLLEQLRAVQQFHLVKDTLEVRRKTQAETMFQAAVAELAQLVVLQLLIHLLREMVALVYLTQ